MKPSEQTIKRHLRELRKVIDDKSSDVVLARIAYAMETAIRWATEDTAHWPPPEKEAIYQAMILRKEMAAKREVCRESR